MKKSLIMMAAIALVGCNGANNQTTTTETTEEQKAVVDANGQKAVEYQRAINRYECDQLIAEWEANGTIEVAHTEDIDTESFKIATSSVADWYINQLMETDGLSEAEAHKLVDAFTE